jgi:hypothetical protein
MTQPGNPETFLADADLAAAAFGDTPGTWPLPQATTATGLWWRAVAAGGQGRYAVANSDLAALSRIATGPLASLAHSTTGSFQRQLGWHDAARGRDGRAWAVAHGDPEAETDALVGLAADALGAGRFAAAHALLTRARDVVERATVPARTPLRLAWVSAELAMVSGDGAGAVRHAAHATELTTVDGIGLRHRVKTSMVVAASHCSVGDVDSARSVGDDALAAAQECGLVPLCWALASLLADIGSAVLTRDDLLDVRDTCADVVSRAGGVWRRR